MGINNEYGSDVFYDEYVGDPQDDDDDHEMELDPETWHDWHSEHLLNMWMGLRAYLEDNHLTSTFLVDATFHDFCEFVRLRSV
jgi:hypothetical protein